MGGEPIKIIEKPWGHEEILEVSNIVKKHLVVKRGHRLSLQYHERKFETMRVLEGEAILHIGKAGDIVPNGHIDKRHLKVGDEAIIEPKTIHRVEALCDCKIYEISTLELNDIVRLEDDYNRGKEDRVD